MIVGDRLRAVRESKNLSQGHIEQKTGLRRCYLSRCENGHTVPSIETLEKWSKALGITMSQLFAEDGREAEPLRVLTGSDSTKLSRLATNSLRRIEMAFAHMNPRDITIVAIMARKLAAKK